jgi:hypothetical protein
MLPSLKYRAEGFFNLASSPGEEILAVDWGTWTERLVNVRLQGDTLLEVHTP